MALDERAARAGSLLPTADEVTAWFDRVRPTTTVGGGSAAHRRLLADVCRRPDLAPLLGGVAVAIRPHGDALFEITGHRSAELSSRALASEPLAALVLRHALELVMLDGSPPTGTGAERAAHRILALHVTAAFYAMMPKADRAAARAGLPAAVTDLFERFARRPERVRACELAETLARTGDSASAGELDEAASAAAPLLGLARPLEWLLTTGGDDRLLTDPQTGSNKYGCTPRPRPEALAYASCTASSISELAYDAAERVRQRLLREALRGDGAAASLEADRARDRLAALLELDAVPGSEILLTSSGTDAELYALCAALGEDADGVVNVVIGPDEIGSGSVAAAAGRHFADHTPLGAGAGPGTPIEGFPTDQIWVECVEVRSDWGAALGPEAVGDRVSEIVGRAELSRRPVLLHVLDGSKTGLVAPPIETARRVRERCTVPVEVVVDAAQMRLGGAAVRSYLEEEFIVLLTGSKFYTGPPFAGALVLPPRVARRLEGMSGLAGGLRDYAARSDLPPRCHHLGAGLVEDENLGLLLRWEAALREMEAFHAVPAEERFGTLDAFARATRQAIERDSGVRLVDGPAVDRGVRGSDGDDWDELPTIFSFLVLRPTGEARPLTVAEARLVYGWLNEDISARLPAGSPPLDRLLAAVPCHIGQPVRIRQGDGESAGALRIAAGARLVSGVAFDERLGETAEERLAGEIQGVLTVLAKISMIVRNWGALTAAGGAATTCGDDERRRRGRGLLRPGLGRRG